MWRLRAFDPSMGGRCDGRQSQRAFAFSPVLPVPRAYTALLQYVELVQHEEDITALAWGLVAGTSTWELASACNQSILVWPIGASQAAGEAGALLLAPSAHTSYTMLTDPCGLPDVPYRVGAALPRSCHVGALQFDGSGTLLAAGIVADISVYRAQASDISGNALVLVTVPCPWP